MRARIVLGALGVVALLLLLFLRAGRDDQRPAAPLSAGAGRADQPGAAEAATSHPTPLARGATRGAPPVTRTFNHPNPVIDRVWVEKLEVCRGEENIAHVDVHTVDGTDADLKISLSGTGFIGSDSTGGKMPFRLLAPTKAEDMPRVMIFGWGATHAQQQLPWVKVKDCDTEPFIRILTRRVVEQGADAFELEAGAPPDATLSDMRWTFGDGQSAKSTDGRVVHDYSKRPQLTRFSNFFITVTATDSQGRALRGSTTIELFNQDYWKRRRGS